MGGWILFSLTSSLLLLMGPFFQAFSIHTSLSFTDPQLQQFRNQIHKGNRSQENTQELLHHAQMIKEMIEPLVYFQLNQESTYI